MRLPFVLLYAFFSLSASAGDFDWKVTNAWSPTYEKKFSEFVAAMGASGCHSLDQCLTSAAGNPFYAARTPHGKKFQADCADFPFALRMYFSWMESLPFDYVKDAVQAEPNQENSGDIRYSKFGNKPNGRRTITKGSVYNAFQEMTNLRNSVSTATYRMHYNEISDFYPPALGPTNIRPGTVVYDPAGHAAIVYKIEKDGRIKMMDAHPDNSVTRITYDQKFARSRPAHGAGFKNWRPELDARPTAQLPGFSTEQYNKAFTMGGESVSYYDYVRAQMSGGNLTFHPVTEIKTMMLEVCSNVHDREASVRAALQAGVQTKNHPARLPKNIYGTEGEWEEFSSPSRDARLKVAFVELRQEIERYVTLYRAHSPRVEYQPEPSKYSVRCAEDNPACFLAASLMKAYEEVALNPVCIFRYTKSDDTEQKLSYTDVVHRLFALSFDPYHCAELRWGASSAEELASCRDDANKLQWYQAERGLRNQTERNYDLPMDFDVQGTSRLGVAKSPDIDLWGYLGKQL